MRLRMTSICVVCGLGVLVPVLDLGLGVGLDHPVDHGPPLGRRHAVGEGDEHLGVELVGHVGLVGGRGRRGTGPGGSTRRRSPPG